MAIHCKEPRATGEISYWCRQNGLKPDTVSSSEQPYALQFSGQWQTAAQAWQQLGCPYEEALALMEGDDEAQRRGCLMLKELGATAVMKRYNALLRKDGKHGLFRAPRSTTAANCAGLTSREMEVLVLLSKKMTNAEIALQLCRSEKTVDHHVSAILSKLEVHTRSEAVSKAHQLGMFAAQ